MRFADSQKTRTGVPVLVTLFVVASLAGCMQTGSTGERAANASHATGPQADYPRLVGDPYEIAGRTYTPADVLNYDEVGYLALDPELQGHTGAHHTLPVPSYVEVTSLENGRTALVRLERRGPMHGHHLLALSPAAMAQIAGNAETPIRVRRVNPPEEERAMLRAGDAAPPRLESPMSLVSVLRRRLPDSDSASLAANHAAPQEIETVEVVASSAVPVEGAAAPAPVSASETEDAALTARGEPAASPDVPDAGYRVQAATFADPANARRAADALGGAVSRSGRYYRVRTGPFATRGEAEASLANVRRAGYSDARILTSG